MLLQELLLDSPRIVFVISSEFHAGFPSGNPPEAISSRILGTLKEFFLGTLQIFFLEILKQYLLVEIQKMFLLRIIRESRNLPGALFGVSNGNLLAVFCSANPPGVLSLMLSGVLLGVFLEFLFVKSFWCFFLVFF